MASEAVRAEGLTKRYGSRAAVRDLTFSIREGEIAGFLGPNGAGKTTTFRMLTTILEPSAGRFWVRGVPHTEPAVIRSCIGVLPESSGYYSSQTGEELLRYFARLHGQPAAEARARARAVLAEVGLAARAGSPVGTYSRGMRQRLGLARALVHDPAVLFLDEPTLGLDPSGHRELLGLVQRAARERGAAVLLSTHQLQDAEELCERVFILNEGALVAHGPAQEVRGLVAAPLRALVRVPAGRRGEALHALRQAPGVRDATEGAGAAGALVVSFEDAPPSPASANAALAVLTAAGVPVLRFEVEGAKLSDAFFALTGKGRA